jgi:glucose/arabinose dehydrogenase
VTEAMTAAEVAAEARLGVLADYLEDSKERLERERKRQHRRRLVGGVIAGTALVATFIAGILAFQTDDQDTPSNPPVQGLNPPTRPVFYDIAGDDAPEFVQIGQWVLPVTSPSEDPWWVPFLPFLGVVLAALLTAGASVWSDRRRAELEDRISEIKAIVKASATVEPAQIRSGADKQAHGAALDP